MSNEINNIEIQIALNKYLILNYDITDYCSKKTNPLPPELIEFQFNFKVDLEKEQEILNLTLDINVIEKNESKNLLSNIKTITSFKILNLNKLIIENRIPNDILIMLSGIIISTARGILFAKFENTNLRNALIPIIDPSQILPKPTT